MAEIIVIAAVAKNNVIGNKGDIPWRIKEDFLHFKKKTLGYPCIMGDRTYESLPVKPLEGRENIILTFDKNYHPDGTVIFFNFEDGLKYVEKKEKAYICGGATIYKIGVQIADTLELTRVNLTPDGDTFFPEINLDEWTLTKEEKHEKYSFLTYKRKNPIKDKIKKLKEIISVKK
jgi:dihydrofolate reductase